MLQKKRFVWAAFTWSFCVFLGCGSARAAAATVTPARMPMRMINPREGIEGNTIYTLWHPDVAMDVPVQIQGGAFPFHYRLSGPEGMTLGSTHGQPNYGILQWDKPVPGKHAVTITATDQEGTVVERSYTLVIQEDRSATDQIVFVDASAAAGGSGSIDSPLQTLSDAQQPAHEGKTVIVRGGRYAITDANRSFQNTRRWVGYPGETIDFVNRKYTTDWKTGDGACINIRWQEIQQDVVYGVDIKHGNGGCMRIWNGGVGFVGYKLAFHDQLFHADEPTNLNQACILLPETKIKENVGLSDIVLENFAYCGIETYMTRYCLLERVTARNVPRSREAPILFHKVGSHFVTTRDCTVWENIHASRPSYSLWAGNLKPADHGEICFSRLATAVSHQQGPGDGGFPHWFYRNTITAKIVDRSEGGSFVYANNVIVAPLAETYQKSGIKHVGKSEFMPDVSGQTASFEADQLQEVLTEAGNLKGAAREKYLGQHGHEIAAPGE